MMAISPAAETRRQRLARYADTALGMIILALVGLTAGVAGGITAHMLLRGCA